MVGGEVAVFIRQTGSLLPLKKHEVVILKGLCAMDENGIIIFELRLLTSETPTCNRSTGYK